MVGPSPTLELESLFVKIYADYQELVSASTQVNAIVNSMEVSLKKFTSALVNIKSAGSAAFAPLIGALTQLTPAMAGADIALVQFGTTLISLNSIISSVANAAAKIFRSFTGISSTGAAANANLTRFGASLSNIDATSTTAAGSLQFLRRSFSLLNRSIGGAEKRLIKFGATLANMGATGGTSGLTPAFTNLNALIGALEAKLVQLIATLREASVAASAFTSPFIVALTKVNTLISGLEIRLAKLAPTIAEVSTVANVSRFNTAITSTGSKLSDLTSSLYSFRTILTGTFAGIALVAFSKFDDGLTRVLAHMRDYQQISRPTLQKELFEISNNSITSIEKLTRGLDVLTSSGMNTQLALRALRVAETFSVAGALEMEDATRKLVTIQNTLGLSSTNAETHLANMARLSNLFVGTAPLVQSSVQQLTEAFTGQYAAAIATANVSLEDAIALIGVYSERGADLRGRQGGDKAARFINELTRRSAEGGMGGTNAFQQLGLEVFDSAGKMLPMENILRNLEKTLGGTSTQAKVAAEALLGFAVRAVNTTRPLTGMADELKRIKEEMAKFGDIAQIQADMIRSSFSGSMVQLYNTAKNAASVIGSYLAPAILMLADALKSTFTWFINLNPAMQNLIVISASFFLLFKPIVALFSMLGNIVLAPLRAIGSIISGIGSVTFSAITGGLNAAWFILKEIWTTLTLIPMGFYYIGKGVLNIIEWFGSLGSVLKDVLKSLALFAANLITTLIGIIAFIPLLIIGFTLLGSIVATIALSVGPVLALIGGGIVALWQGMKAKAEEAHEWAVNKAVELKDKTVEIWEANKAKAQEYFNDLGKMIEGLAGFFWHFQENMQVILKWLGSNWKEVLWDIGRIFTLVIENMIKNIATMGKFILDSAGAAWKGFWEIAGEYIDIITNGFSNNWKNMLSDMGTLFKAFVQALIENFALFWDFSSKMAVRMLGAKTPEEIDKTYNTAKAKLDKQYAVDIDYEKSAVGVFGGPLEEPLQNRLMKLQGKYNEQLSELKTNRDADKIIHSGADLKADFFASLKGPGDFLKDTKFKTNFGPMFEQLGKATTEFAPNTLGGIGRSIGDAWGVASNAMKPLLGNLPEELSADWKGLFKNMNFTLPPDWTSKTIDALSRFISPAVGKMGDPILGGAGPGFDFKQISATRYMLGGDTARTLDYQQLMTLQAIDKKLGLMLEQRGEMLPELHGPRMEE